MNKVKITRERWQAFKAAMLQGFPGIAPYHMDDAIAVLLGFDNSEALSVAFDLGKGEVAVVEFCPERMDRRLREVPSYPWLDPRKPPTDPSNTGKRRLTLAGAMRSLDAMRRLLEED